jgi:hypothetical protein
MQEDLELANPILKGVKETLFLTSNALILQSMQLTSKKIPHILLVV